MKISRRETRSEPGIHCPKDLCELFVKRSREKEEAVEVLRANLGPGDVLLIKASRGMAFGAIVAELIG